MKKYILLLLILCGYSSFAQIQIDSLIAKQKIKLHGYYLTGVSNDSAINNQDSGKAMTEYAAKKMILGRSASRDIQMAAKMNYTDTLAMLSNYITAINNRLKYSDSIGMLAAYQTAINLKLKYTDSASMLAAYQSALNVRLKYTDSALMLVAYKTAINSKQSTLISGTNIKTVNGNSILGSGDIIAGGVSLSGTNTWTGVQTFNPTVNSVSIGGAVGTKFLDTLKASGTNDSLIAVNIAPTFNNNSYTGIKQSALRLYSGSLDFGNFSSQTNAGVGSGNVIGQINFNNGTSSSNYQRCYISASQVTTSNLYDVISIVAGVGTTTTSSATFGGFTGGCTFNNGTTINGGATISGGTTISSSATINSTLSTLNGSTSGFAYCSEPINGNYYKEVIIYCNALVGTITYTFPTAFTYTPVIVNTNGISSSLVTSLSNSSCTVTGSTTTGFLNLKGY